MSSADFPDGSRGNPAIIPESDSDDDETYSSTFADIGQMGSGDFSDGSWENPAIIPDDEAPSSPLRQVANALLRADEDLMAAQTLLRLRNHDEETFEERVRRLAAESAEWKKNYVYRVANDYAHDLHSRQIPEIVQEQRKQQVEEDGSRPSESVGPSRFMEAKEAIKNRRRDSFWSTTSSGGMELNLVTQRTPPTLMEMSARVLAQNSEAIKSLNLVPDHLRKKLSNLVSDLGKVNTRFMQLLIEDSPSEISARNCVGLEEKDLTEILCDCDTVSLKVLSLDLCGRGMTENTITEFLKRSPNGFPLLTTLSLQGAFCLTDNALALISRSAPLLQLINLSECSLLTFHAVKILADEFGSTLRGLNIGGCQGIKPSYVFKSSLSKFEKLNYLSVAGLERIHEVVVEFLTSRGSNLTDLSLASCSELTDGTIWTVARHCPKLEALDISDLDNLTDESLKEIADGCRCLNSVKLTKNRFSDEAIAAFLEVSGGSLNQLCLDNVRDVGQDTAISLAKNCRRLRYLGLSWCRKLTEEDLIRILSYCSLLRSLKLFGWTQVRDGFLEELSKSEVHIVGLKMTSVFAHLDDSYSSVDAKFF